MNNLKNNKLKIDPGEVAGRLVLYEYLQRKISTTGLTRSEYKHFERLASNGYPSFLAILRLGREQGHLVWKNGFLIKKSH